MSEKTPIATKDAVKLIEEKLAQKGEALLTIKGTSMRPFYVDQKTIVRLTRPKTLKKGTAVLVRYRDAFVLHRIVKTKGDTLVLMGDGRKTKETVHIGDVIAAVAAHKTNKRWIDEEGFFFRMALTLWRWLRFMRRALLKLCRILLKR